MKQYITWKRKKINDFRYEDPNTNDRVNVETGWITTFFETPYQITDGRFISYVEYPDITSVEEVEYFRNLDPDFSFTFIDELEANTLLSELWDVTVSDFVFTDNRPQDIF